MPRTRSRQALVPRSQILESLVRVADGLSLGVTSVIRRFGVALLPIMHVRLMAVGVRDPFIDVLDPCRHVIVGAAKRQCELLESHASGAGHHLGVICTEKGLPPAHRRRRAQRYAPCYAIVCFRRPGPVDLHEGTIRVPAGPWSRSRSLCSRSSRPAEIIRACRPASSPFDRELSRPTMAVIVIGSKFM